MTTVGGGGLGTYMTCHISEFLFFCLLIVYVCGVISENGLTELEILPS